MTSSMANSEICRNLPHIYLAPFVADTILNKAKLIPGHELKIKLLHINHHYSKNKDNKSNKIV